MKNIPYKKVVDENGNITNFPKDGVISPYPNRKSRRLNSKGKVYIQRDFNGNEVGRIRTNGNNSKLTKGKIVNNSTLNYLLKKFSLKVIKNEISSKLKKLLN